MNREHELTRLAQQWEELTIANDRMFSMAMENNAICRELLRRIFPELAIDRVQRVTVQKQVNTPLDARTVRFDVYIRDDQQRTYIVEMQVANRQNLPYRLRYYLEQVDYSILGPGDNYEKLAGYPTSSSVILTITVRTGQNTASSGGTLTNRTWLQERASSWWFLMPRPAPFMII